VEAISVLVAATNPGPASQLRALLSDDPRFEVIGEARSGEEMVAFSGQPGLVVVDLALGGLNAHDTIEQYRRRHGKPLIAVVTPVEAEYLRQAMISAGANAYLVVTSPSGEMLDHLAALVDRACAGRVKA